MSLTYGKQFPRISIQFFGQLRFIPAFQSFTVSDGRGREIKATLMHLKQFRRSSSSCKNSLSSRNDSMMMPWGWKRWKLKESAKLNVDFKKSCQFCSRFPVMVRMNIKYNFIIHKNKIHSSFHPQQICKQLGRRVASGECHGSEWS